MFSKILVPVVDTPLSQRAARFGFALAARLRASLVLVHATAHPGSAAALTLLADWEQFGADTAVPFETVLAPTDDAARAIADAAQVNGTDLIVMGTHAREGLPRLLLGSVAERVLGLTPVPVMLLRDTTPEVAQFERVLVPLDGSATGNLALDAALDLAQRLGSSLTLLHAVPEPALLTGDFTGNGSYVDTDWPAELAALRRDGQLLLERTRAQCDSVKVRTQLLEPNERTLGRRDVGSAILDVAREDKSDLIVMGTHGRRGLERLLLGSVAQTVAHHADVPVLLLNGVALKADHTAAVPVAARSNAALERGVVG
jgi:nucleotide-binding universal stress UspA family protein